MSLRVVSGPPPPVQVIYSRERLKGKGGLKGATPQSAAGKAPPYSTPAAAAGGYGAGAGAGANAWGAPQQQQQPAKSGGVFTPLAQEVRRCGVCLPPRIASPPPPRSALHQASLAPC